MIYSIVCLLIIKFTLILSQETSQVNLNYNNIKDRDKYFFENDTKYINERRPKILNYGNIKRNFFNIESPNVIDINNVTLISKLIPEQTQVLLLVHDSDNNDEMIRDNIIRALINSSILTHNLLLMKFNSSDTDVVKYVRNDVDLFKNRTKSFLGINKNEEKKAGAVFFSLLKSTALLKDNSAIVIFTSGRIEDEDIAELAYKELYAKNIKVFLVWNDDYQSKEKYERLIAEIVSRTGGLVFTKIQNQKYYTIDENSAENSTMSLIVNKMNLFDENTISFPVDSGTVWLHISLPRKLLNSILKTPVTGYNINLGLVKNMTKFMNSHIHIEEGNDKIYHISKPRTGVWVLNIKGIPLKSYNVQISVQNDLFVNTEIVKQLKDKHNLNKNVNIQMKFHGLYKKIDEIILINENGDELYNEDLTKLRDVTLINNTDKTGNVYNMNVNKIANNDTLLYVKTTGKDFNGNPFVRLSYVYTDEYNQRLQPLTIEIGEGSDLYATPNQLINIYFKITNNRMHQVYLQFHCKSNRRILRTMNPYRAIINPRQTITVNLNLYTIPEAGLNFRDDIRFTANGYYAMEKIVYVTVSDTIPIDNIKPEVWYTFTKSCSILNKCHTEDWNAEITAQDSQTGLREFTSLPKGLYFKNGYTSGTKEPITGYYSGSCCQSNIQIIAYDVMNNKKYYDIDAYRAPLGAGAIAAIILGIIIIIAIITGLIIWCKYKKNETGSFDLPTYRGPTRRCD